MAVVTDSLYKRLVSTLSPLSDVSIGGNSGDLLEETVDSKEGCCCD